MKYFTLLVLLLEFSMFYAQKIQITEPEWIGDIVYVNDSIGDGVKLEMQKAFTQTKAGASLYVVGVGKVKSTTHVKGTASKTRIINTENIRFIIKNENNLTSPKSIINIFKLNTNDNTRFIAISSLGTYSGAETMNIDFIDFNAKKYGESSYIITIPKLENGEYAITLAQSRMDFNLFSVYEPRAKTKEEIIKETVKQGDIVWFKKNDEWVKAIAIEQDYYGLRVSYTKNEKTKKKVIAYNLISLDKK